MSGYGIVHGHSSAGKERGLEGFSPPSPKFIAEKFIFQNLHGSLHRSDLLNVRIGDDSGGVSATLHVNRHA